MSRKYFCLLAAWAGILFFSAPVLAQESGKKINVLLIAVDDLNCNLACYGHPVVKSPQIDRLAARGVRFERAYCQYPLCNPSRTSFMSGRRPDTTKVLDNSTEPRTTLGNILFLNEYFGRHGYFTARVGKIFHGAFAATGRWDVSEDAGKKKGKAGQETEVLFQDKKKKQPAGGLKISWQATDRADEEEPDGRTARRIVELLKKHKDGPFFIAAGFHKPHLAFIAPKKYFDLYPPAKIQLPQEPPDFRKNVPALAFTRTAGDDQMTTAQKQQAIAAYYACVSFMDAQVGIILDAVERLGLWENTIIIFWSDHGFHLADHGNLWRKMTLFEVSARVPFIVAAPKIKGNATSPRLVELVDIFPTLTDFCRLPTPDGLEGASCVPLLHDPQRPWRKGAFTVVSRGKSLGRTVRTERYRYTEWGDDENMAELYDHATDSSELSNRINDPAYRERVTELRRLLRDGWKGSLPPQ